MNINKFLKFFSIFDYFGIQISFRKSGKEENFTTPLGGTIFIVFFCLSIAYFILNFIPFSLRQNLTLVLFDKTEVPNRQLNFTDMKLNVAFNLIYDNNTFLRPEIQKLFVFKVRHKLIDNLNTVSRNLNIKKCEKSDFFNYTDYDDNLLKDYLCIDSKDLFVRGSFANKPFEYIQIDIDLDKTVLNENLEIYKNLFTNESILFNIKYMDTAIDVENINNPLKKFVESKIIYLDYWMIRKVNLYYNSLELWNDENILYNDFTLNKSFKLETFEEYSKYYNDRKVTNQSTELLRFYIRSSSNIIVYKRSFQKFTDYLANTSTIISQIFLILFLFTTYINSFFSKQKIMNRILNYKEFIQEKNKLNMDLIKQSINNKDQNLRINTSIDKLRNTEPKNEYLTINKRKETISLEINDEKNLAANDINLNNKEKSENQNLNFTHSESEYEPVDFNVCEIFVRMFKCGRKLKQKNFLYLKSLDKINNYLSVFTYIRTVQSLEILKYCLLSKEQLSLFNFISKPFISYLNNDERFNNQFEDYERIISFNDINSMLNDYRILKNDSSKINEKLLEMFNYEIERFIK